MYMTIFEEGRRRAKDKIDVAGDVTVLEILPSAVYQDRVLPAEEATVAKHDAIAFDPNRQRLAHRAGHVLKGDVFNGEIVRVDEGRRSAKCADRLSVGANHVRVEIVREHSL